MTPAGCTAPGISSICGTTRCGTPSPTACGRAPKPFRRGARTRWPSRWPRVQAPCLWCGSGGQQISPPAQRAFNPSVAVDARSRVYVAWDSSGQIYLRRRDGAWRGVERIGDPPGNARPIIAAAGRSVLLMWTQQHGDEAQLRVAVVTETGAPSPRARPPWGLIAAGLLVVTYYLLSAARIWRRTGKTV